MLRTATIGAGCLLLCQFGLALSNGVQPAQPKPAPAAEAAEKELEKLQGVWYHVSRQVGGKEVAGEDKEYVLVVRGNIAVLKSGDKVGQVLRLKIVDSTSNPRKLDVVITDGPNEGMTVLSVYQVDGDLFRYCGSVKSRPMSITTNANDRNEAYVSTFKKLKK